MAALTMTRGDSATITLTVVDGLNQPLNLTGRTLRFTAKRGPADTQLDALIVKSTGTGITHQAQTGATVGLADVAITPVDTASLPAATLALRYDVQLTDGASIYTTERGTLTIVADVTTS